MLFNYSLIQDNIPFVQLIMIELQKFEEIKDKEDYIGVITDRDICLSIPTINNINDSIKSYITNNIVYMPVIENLLKMNKGEVCTALDSGCKETYEK